MDDTDRCPDCGTPRAPHAKFCAGTASVTVHGTCRPSLRPGDYFGEISLIDGKPRSATVVAETPLTTISLVAWAFQPILDDEPEVAKVLLLHMCARLRAAESG